MPARHARAAHCGHRGDQLAQSQRGTTRAGRAAFVTGEFRASFVYVGRGAWRSRSRAAALVEGGGGGRRRRARRPALTGLEAPLLQLDEARRLEQRVEEAHVGSAGGARGTTRPLSRRDCHAPAPHAAAHVAAAGAPMGARRARHVAPAARQWARGASDRWRAGASGGAAAPSTCRCTPALVAATCHRRCAVSWQRFVYGASRRGCGAGGRGRGAARAGALEPTFTAPRCARNKKL